MPFNDEERTAMLALKGVGATVIVRLEQLGFTSLTELKNTDANAITQNIAQMLRKDGVSASRQGRIFQRV